jgi:hypothetical protein
VVAIVVAMAAAIAAATATVADAVEVTRAPTGKLGRLHREVVSRWPWAGANGDCLLRRFGPQAG